MTTLSQTGAVFKPRRAYLPHELLGKVSRMLNSGQVWCSGESSRNMRAPFVAGWSATDRPVYCRQAGLPITGVLGYFLLLRQGGSGPYLQALSFLYSSASREQSAHLTLRHTLLFLFSSKNVTSIALSVQSQAGWPSEQLGV